MQIHSLMTKLEETIFLEIAKEINSANDKEKIAYLINRLPNSPNVEKVIQEIYRNSPTLFEQEMADAVTEAMNAERVFLDEAFEMNLIEKPLKNKYFDYIVKEQSKTAQSIFAKYLNRIPHAYKNLLSDMLEIAYVQYGSGVLTREQVTQNVIKQMLKQGVIVNGRSPHAFAREQILSARNKAIQESKEVQMNELDIKFVITTEHNGARPNHANWQGQVMKRKDLKSKTGLGSASGLLGINCRHNYHAYFEELDTYDVLNVSRETSDKRYEAEQKLRAYERKVRKWKMQTTLEKETNTYSAKTGEKAKYWETEAKRFAKENGLTCRKQ